MAEVYVLVLAASMAIVLVQALWKLVRENRNQPKKLFVHVAWIAWLVIASSQVGLVSVEGWRWIFAGFALWCSWNAYEEMQNYLVYKDAQKGENAPE